MPEDGIHLLRQYIISRQRLAILESYKAPASIIENEEELLAGLRRAIFSEMNRVRRLSEEFLEYELLNAYKRAVNIIREPFKPLTDIPEYRSVIKGWKGMSPSEKKFMEDLGKRVAEESEASKRAREIYLEMSDEQVSEEVRKFLDDYMSSCSKN